MAKFNLDYYAGEDLYSDGDIEQTILEIVQNNKRLEELGIVEFPIVYHLAEDRKNILNWYPFKKDAVVLEVGAGCGAITGLLCEKAGRVVAAELSKQRALINYERHQQYNNLELMVGNFNDIKFEEDFDYIILNGVFEYAASFTEGKKPYEIFLRSLAGKLKKDGRILIAIENRLGIKYFSGAAEDHTDSFFLGMNNYEREENVRTFSKHELTELCQRVGMICNKFYYPYPDYKFPNEIYTDHTINSMGYGKDYYNFNRKRFLLYNECAVMESLRKENVADIFANSFLVEVCHRRQADEREIEYVKINSDRRMEFQIGTRIENENGKGYVYKYPLQGQANMHIESMHLHEQKEISKRISLLTGDKIGDELRYPMLKIDTLNQKVARELSNGNKDEIICLLDAFFNLFFRESEVKEFRTEEFERTFGKVAISETLECVKPANIDATCDNVFCEGDTYQIIDGEWIFDFWVPKQFIIWRNLNELYEKNKALEQLLSREEFLRHYKINENMEAEFYSWNRYFTLEFVKANQMEKYSVEKKQISLDELSNQMERQKKMMTALYVDYGQGYQEETKIYKEIPLNKEGDFEGIYEIDNLDKVKRMRWDPIENRFCMCKVFAGIGDDVVRLKAANAELVSDGHDVFLNGDPQYEVLVGMSDCTKLVVHGQFRYLDEEKMLKFLQVQEERWNKKDHYILQMENTSRDMQQKLDELSKDLIRIQEEKMQSEALKVQAETLLNAMVNTRGWKLLEKVRKVKQIIWRQHE